MRLVVLTSLAFVIQFIALRSPAGRQVFEFLYLNPEYIRPNPRLGYIPAIWELVTYMFCHSPGLMNFMFVPIPTHLAFNMFVLWMFGREVEMNLGSRAFLRLYFAAGIVAGLCALIPGFITGRPTLGASGAVLGILGAYGHLFPDRIILVFFIIPMRVRYFVWVVAALDLYGAIVGGARSNVAHLAHIGGLFTGILMMRRGWYRRPWLDLEGRQRRSALERERRTRRRVDELLDKISREGLNSLSREEREFLERARRGR